MCYTSLTLQSFKFNFGKPQTILDNKKLNIKLYCYQRNKKCVFSTSDRREREIKFPEFFRPPKKAIIPTNTHNPILKCKCLQKRQPAVSCSELWRRCPYANERKSLFGKISSNITITCNSSSKKKPTEELKLKLWKSETNKNNKTHNSVECNCYGRTSTKSCWFLFLFEILLKNRGCKRLE